MERLNVHRHLGLFKCADGFKVLLNWMERTDGLFSQSVSRQPPSLSLSDISMQFIFIHAVHFFQKICFNCALQPALCLSQSGRKCHIALAARRVIAKEALWSG